MTFCFSVSRKIPGVPMRMAVGLMSTAAAALIIATPDPALAASDQAACKSMLEWTRQEQQQGSGWNFQMDTGVVTDEKLQEVFGYPSQQWDEKVLKEIRNDIEKCQKQTSDRYDRGLYSRTQLLVNRVVSYRKQQEQIEAFYQQTLRKIEESSTPDTKTLTELAQYARGGGFVMSGLSEAQKKELSERAGAKQAELQKPFVEARLNDIRSLPNEEGSLGKINQVCGACGNVFGSNLVDEEAAKLLTEAAKAKRVEIITAAGKPYVDRVNAIPETIEGIPAMNAMLSELSKPQQYSEVRSTVATWIIDKRRKIVEAHQQTLCDAAIERLDVKDSTANQRVYAGMPVTLRDFVCEAAKRGVEVNYVEPGLFSFGGKPRMEIKLADTDVEIRNGILKPDQVTTVDVSEIQVPDSIFGPGGKAIAGTYINDGSGGRNMTTQDWERFVSAIMTARPAFVQS